MSTRRHGTGAATRPGDAIDLPVASLILEAERPLVMLGAGANRPRLAEALSAFVNRVQIPFFNTQMGKGSVAGLAF